ncbi:hypothetical protein GQ602_002700 [Ophiocordyceps camponoti-floridani]|uniref:Uncharacterized protein n=1 Tax=Ophiocordyceps camponoti-floridani TaxID=2030778 RepID=A0A8H4QB85_9HYPO|nr:hypothetical protein GQ602_002700 [Ophiocordyceps camponoti-floridani]
MLRRLPLAALRASVAASTARTTVPSLVSTARTISLRPWKRKATPALPLPVYFPRETWSTRLNYWKAPVVRAILSTFLGLLGFLALISVTLVPLMDWADEEWELLSDAEREAFESDHGDDDAWLFIPFPPFAHFTEVQSPYDMNDPDTRRSFQEFLDPVLQQKIRSEVYEIIFYAMGRETQISQVLGTRNPRVGRQWLDLTYPFRPPNKEYMAGLFFRSDGIYLGLQQIDDVEAQILKKTIWPESIALASLTFGTSLVKHYFENFLKHDDTAQASSNKTQPASPVSVSKPTPTKNPDEDADAPKPSFLSALKPTHLQVLHDSKRPSESVVDPYVRKAMMDGYKKWRACESRVETPLTAGAIAVRGAVEFYGPRFALTFHFRGYYDPKPGKWLGLKITLLHLRDRVTGQIVR